MKSGSSNCLLFFLVQITQDAVLCTCRFPGTAHVPGMSQGLSLRHSAVMPAQPQELSLPQHNLWDSFLPHNSSFHHKQPQKHLFFTLQQESSHHRLAVGGCCGTCQHCRSCRGHAAVEGAQAASPWRREQPRALPSFQLILPCASEQPLPSTFRGCRERDWVGLCATSLVRQSQAPGSGHSKAPVNGAGTALLHFHPCCPGQTPRDAFSASGDAGLGRIGFSGRAGKPQDQRLRWGQSPGCSVSTAHSPWYQHRALPG